MTASADSRATGRTRAVVAEFLRHHPGSTPKAIALGAGLSRELAKRTALRMAADGELTVAGRGHYFWVPPHRRYLAVVPDVPGDTAAEETTAPDVPAEPASCRPRCSQCGWRAAQPVPVGERARCEQCGFGFVAEDAQVPR